MSTSTRIASIDRMRGIVMILMAIDHVRVYAGIPAGGATPALFFTRWITHFCAPAFVFLAGSGAYFYGRRHADLSRFLWTRGLWLIVLELSYLRLVWSFNLSFTGLFMAGVIWVIGWSMLALALLSKLPIRWIAVVGLLVVCGHNLVDPHMQSWTESSGQHSLAWLWSILYAGFYTGPLRLGSEHSHLIVLYSLIPWIGVMACGYAFGRVLEDPRRDALCLWIGLLACAAFLLLRGFNLYGDPRPWSGDPNSGMPAWLSFLNTTKYPASLCFLLMTLGPTIASLPWLERMQGRFMDFLATFGRVPFFYYMLHIPLVHAMALLVSKLRTGAVDPWLFADHPMGNPPVPDTARWDLPLLYAVWALCIALLYWACARFARLKATRSAWWLRYL